MLPANLDGAAKFLIAFDALVAQDPRPPVFTGKIGFGIRDEAADVWWIAEIGTRIETRFASEPATGLDVQVLLGEYELRTYLETGRFPSDAKTIGFEGDIGLFCKLTERYGASMSAIDLRVSESDDDRRKRRKKRRNKRSS